MVAKRSARAGVEDRWHRSARHGEQVAWPADGATDKAMWCTDARHGEAGTFVKTVRHDQGKRWLARWTDHGGETRSRSFDRKAEAQNHITNITTAMTTGTYADPQRSVVTFSEVSTRWLAATKNSLKPATYAEYRSVLEGVVLPKWGEARLRDIDHADIQEWVTWLSVDPAARTRRARATSQSANAGLSPARVIHAYQVVQQVLATAVRSKFIAANPTDGVKLPRKSPKEETALSHDQVRQLADAAGDMRAMVYTLAYGGFRYGECAALRVKDVDVSNRRVWVSRSVTGVARLGMVEGPTKTYADRKVPLPQFVMGMVAAQVEGKAADELVFAREDGTWLRVDRFRKRFDEACATAGLSGITPKTLRHTAGSLALASGATVVTVQKLLGHKTPLVTLSIYSHMLPDDFDNLAAAMDAAAAKAAE